MDRGERGVGRGKREEGERKRREERVEKEEDTLAFAFSSICFFQCILMSCHVPSPKLIAGKIANHKNFFPSSTLYQHTNDR